MCYVMVFLTVDLSRTGDIINFEVTLYHNGYCRATSETFSVVNVDECGEKLVEVARRCRDEATEAGRVGFPSLSLETQSTT